jgi:ABC-type multidrug transport system fused ATPase/permease subunit
MLWNRKWQAEARWLAAQVRPLLPLSLANFTCIVIGSTLTLADPLIIKWLIDVAIPRRSLRLVLLAAAADGVTYLASLGMSYLGTVLSSIVGQKMVFRIRLSLLRHVDDAPATYRGDTQVGETLYRLEQDVDRIAELSGDIVPMGMHMIAIGVMAAVAMTWLNWRLTAVVVPLLPVFYFLQQKFAGRLKSAADAAQAQSGKMSAFLQEHLTGLLQLQLLNRSGAQRRRFARLSAEGAKRQVRQRLAEVWFGASSASLVVLGMSLILGLGGYQVVIGSLTIGGLVAFYAYVVRLFEPITIAIDLQSRFQRVSASVRRILEIVQLEKPTTAVAPAILLDRTSAPELAFQSVSFSYRHDRPVLHDLSFQVNPGETVAVVGLNGSGKSTVGMLAARVYHPHSGAVFVGGRDIRDITRGNLRSLVTLVPQDPILFDDTVRENLLYGNPEATSADLERVSMLTSLDQVLRKLPKGFDEPLGPLGARLSGGEKKRLALARTLLQGPRILIVDEVTGALDAPTAAALLKGLESFREDRTLIIISHRPATILWAQRILVVEDGHIAASGRHSELIDRCPAYQAIWAAQYETPSSR